MYNIHMIKGKVNMDNYNEKLLELNKSRLYNNSKIVDKRKNVKKRLISSLIIISIIYIIVFIVGIFILKRQNLKFEKDITFIVSFFLVMVFSFYIYPILHEIVHALVYPKKDRKIICKLGNFSYLTYCNACITKNRMILMLIMPFLIFGIVQFIIWIFVIPFLNAGLAIGIYSSIIYIVFTCISDLGASYLVLTEVSKGAKVFMYGSELYYIE